MTSDVRQFFNYEIKEKELKDKDWLKTNDHGKELMEIVSHIAIAKVYYEFINEFYHNN